VLSRVFSSHEATDAEAAEERKLDAKCVGGYCKPAATAIKVYVNGDAYSGNPPTSS
jgi:hypothetical protein